MKTNNKPVGKLLKEEPFEIFDSALACVLFIAFNILFVMVVRATKIMSSGSAIVSFIVQALVEAVFAVAAWTVAYSRKKSIVYGAGMNKKVNWKIVGWCFLASLVSLIGFGNLTNVFLEFLQYFGYSSILGNIEINTFWQYLGYVISSCAIAAFCEELLFRGVIESGFKKWGIKVAVGFSALIFMLMHGNAEQTVHQFIVGVIVGYVFYKTNNLWLGVLIHAFNNFIPITQAYLLSFIETTETVSTTATIGLGTILIDLVIAVAVAWAGFYFISLILKQIIKENDKINKQETEENLASIKVDGDEQSVEISIDGGEVIEGEEYKTASATKPEKPKVPAAAIVMFTIAGMYLIGEWLIYTIYGFLQ